MSDSPLHTSSRRPRLRAEAGFTLIEVMSVTVLAGILFTLGALAFRHYWLAQALDGGQKQMITKLRQLQERSISESHPLVYGARLTPGSSEWHVVKYDPNATPSVCREVADLEFADGVVVASASFATAAGITSACSGLGAPGDAFVFFFARGNATGGGAVLEQERTGRTREVVVTPVTGRVDAAE